MDLEKYRVTLQNVSTKELKQRRMDALENSAGHLLTLIEVELDKRSPGWRNPHGFGKPQPTYARFREEAHDFPSQIEAYLFLMERFVDVRPSFLESEDHMSRVAIAGRAGKFFARTPIELWNGSPHLAEDGHYAQLSNGWYASTNLSRGQKVTVLSRFAAFAQIPGTDWEFFPDINPVDDTNDFLNSFKPQQTDN